MTVNKKSLKNLVHFKAPDLDNTGVIMSVRVPFEDKEWLREFPEGISYHTRKAIAMYRMMIEEDTKEKAYRENTED